MMDSCYGIGTTYALDPHDAEPHIPCPECGELAREKDTRIVACGPLAGRTLTFYRHHRRGTPSICADECCTIG